MKRLLTLLCYLSALSSFAQLPNTLSAADKVYGLSRFWQEVNYNFVYLDRIDRAKWDEAYKQAIITVQQTPNDYQYYRELQKFCALLKDGHTNIYPPQMPGVTLMTSNFGDYRLFIQNIADKAIIVRTNLSKKDEIPIGSEVIEVNGQSVQEYRKQNVAPYIASSTDYIVDDWSTGSLLQGLEGASYRVKIKKPKGQIVTLNLTHSLTTEKEVYPVFEPNRALLDFKWYPNQIAYVSLNSFENPKIDSLFTALLPELAKAKGLIIDLRYNGGGNTTIGTNILQYLTADKVIYGSRNSTRMHVPAYKAWGKFIAPTDTLGHKERGKYLLSYQDKYFYHFPYSPDTLQLTASKIVVPTALLIGHNTASAAEDFLIYADNQSHMTKIGVNTFGSTGQPYMFSLPGGGEARVCTKKDTYPDGREFVGYGVKPDLEVKPTLKDYLSSNDPVLKKALTLLRDKVK